MGAQETVLCLVVVAVIVVTAISISIAIQAITVFIISMMVILLVIVIYQQLLLLITIGPIVDICVFIFDQFLIRYVPMLASILVELLVLVGLVEHDAMLVVGVVDSVVRRVFRVVLFILLIMSEIILVVVLITIAAATTVVTSDLVLDFFGATALLPMIIFIPVAFRLLATSTRT